MTEVFVQSVGAAAVIFCRVTGCLMILPGFSSARVPVRVRVYIALLVSLTLSPALVPVLLKAQPELTNPGVAVPLIATEFLKGAALGVAARLLLGAIEFVGSTIANVIGLGTMPGAPIEGFEPVPTLNSIMMLFATLLIFATGLHWSLLSALVNSYTLLPADGWFEAQPTLIHIANQMVLMAWLSAKLAGPFLVYGIVFNLAMGLTNKMTPQIPIFFVSIPFVLAGGLLLLYFSFDEIMRSFLDVFGDWANGI